MCPNAVPRYTVPSASARSAFRSDIGGNPLEEGVRDPPAAEDGDRPPPHLPPEEGAVPRFGPDVRLPELPLRVRVHDRDVGVGPPSDAPFPLQPQYPAARPPPGPPPPLRVPRS